MQAHLLDGFEWRVNAVRFCRLSQKLGRLKRMSPNHSLIKPRQSFCLIIVRERRLGCEFEKERERERESERNLIQSGLN